VHGDQRQQQQSGKEAGTRAGRWSSADANFSIGGTIILDFDQEKLEEIPGKKRA